MRAILSAEGTERPVRSPTSADEKRKAFASAFDLPMRGVTVQADMASTSKATSRTKCFDPGDLMVQSPFPLNGRRHYVHGCLQGGAISGPKRTAQFLRHAPSERIAIPLKTARARMPQIVLALSFSLPFSSCRLRRHAVPFLYSKRNRTTFFSILRRSRRSKIHITTAGVPKAGRVEGWPARRQRVVGSRRGRAEAPLVLRCLTQNARPSASTPLPAAHAPAPPSRNNQPNRHIAIRRALEGAGVELSRPRAEKALGGAVGGNGRLCHVRWFKSQRRRGHTRSPSVKYSMPWNLALPFLRPRVEYFSRLKKYDRRYIQIPILASQT